MSDERDTAAENQVEPQKRRQLLKYIPMALTLAVLIAGVAVNVRGEDSYRNAGNWLMGAQSAATWCHGWPVYWASQDMGPGESSNWTQKKYEAKLRGQPEPRRYRWSMDVFLASDCRWNLLFLALDASVVFVAMTITWVVGSAIFRQR